MRSSFWWTGALAALALVLVVSPSTAQAPDNFRWVDFHSPNDQDVVNWVRRALDEQKWTAIREIGVEYDQALVITTNRNSAQGTPNRDSFSIWSVSLANRALTHIIDGTNLRMVDWLLLDVTSPRELGVLYDDCADCDATTYFTTLHYDLRQHTWAARWLQGGGKTVTVWFFDVPVGHPRVDDGVLGQQVDAERVQPRRTLERPQARVEHPHVAHQEPHREEEL